MGNLFSRRHARAAGEPDEADRLAAEIQQLQRANVEDPELDFLGQEIEIELDEVEDLDGLSDEEEEGGALGGLSADDDGLEEFGTEELEELEAELAQLDAEDSDVVVVGISEAADVEPADSDIDDAAREGITELPPPNAVVEEVSTSAVPDSATESPPRSKLAASRARSPHRSSKPVEAAEEFPAAPKHSAVARGEKPLPPRASGRMTDSENREPVLA